MSKLITIMTAHGLSGGFRIVVRFQPYYVYYVISCFSMLPVKIQNGVTVLVVGKNQDVF